MMHLRAPCPKGASQRSGRCFAAMFALTLFLLYPARSILWRGHSFSISAGEQNAAAQSPPTSTSAASVKARKDVFFLVDVTGSMVGLPRGAGNKDILGLILKRVVEHVDFHGADGDQLFVATFQDKLHDLDGPGIAFEAIRTFQMRRDVDAAKRYILSIEQGVRQDKNAVPMTGIYDSLAQMFRVMREEANKASKGPDGIENYSQRLVLFTDGEENIKPMKMGEIQDMYRLLREESGLGDRIFFKALVYGRIKPPCQSDPKMGINCEGARPDEPVQYTLQVRPTQLDLGNLYGVGERRISLEFDPRTTGLQGIKVALRQREGNFPPDSISVDPNAKVADGRAEVVFRFSEADKAEQLLRQMGKPLRATGKLVISTEDARFAVNPAALGFVARYEGTRDISVLVKAGSEQIEKMTGDAWLTQFRKTSQAVPLLEARFSSLADKDKLAVSIRQVGGVVSREKISLSAGMDPPGKGIEALEAGSSQPLVNLYVPAVPCMPSGRAKYEVRMEAPAGVTFRVQTMDGQPVQLAEDGRSTIIPVTVAATNYPACPPPIWPFVVGALALLGSGFGAIVANRPGAAARLEGQGLPPHRLRKVQGIFSQWVVVGSNGDLKHAGLPERAFKIKATRFGGIRFVPLVGGVEVMGRECEVGRAIQLAKDTTIWIRGVGRPEVSLRVVA